MTIATFLISILNEQTIKVLVHIILCYSHRHAHLLVKYKNIRNVMKCMLVYDHTCTILPIAV